MTLYPLANGTALARPRQDHRLELLVEFHYAERYAMRAAALFCGYVFGLVVADADAEVRHMADAYLAEYGLGSRGAYLDPLAILPPQAPALRRGANGCEVLIQLSCVGNLVPTEFGVIATRMQALRGTINFTLSRCSVTWSQVIEERHDVLNLDLGPGPAPSTLASTNPTSPTP